MEPLHKWTRWKRRLPGVEMGVLPDFTGRPNPVLAGRRLYVSSFSPGAVWALDAASGDIRWKVPIGDLGGAAMLVTPRAVLAKTAQEVCCISRATGALRWTFSPYGHEGETLYTSPVAVGDSVFLGDRRGLVHALETSTGRPIWTVDAGRGAQVNATPATDGRLLFFATNGAEAVALEAKDGSTRWRISLDGACIWSPVVVGRDVLVRTERTILRIHRADGSVRHVWKPGDRIRAAIAVGDRVLAVVGDDESTLRLLVLRHGETLHDHPYPELGGPETLRFVPLTGLVYDCRIGGLGILEPRTGERLFEFTGLDEPVAHVDAHKSSIFALDNRGVVRALRHPPCGRH